MVRHAIAIAACAVMHAMAAHAVEGRNNYLYPENWLCHPDHNEACDSGLTVAVVGADGKITQQSLRSDPNAPIDCFYVYPTVSRELTPLSDMVAGSEERRIVQQQLVPFSSKCRLYAPLYRQITLASLEAESRGIPPSFDPVVPARDVVDAWKTYIAHDNAGRGFVLIGHSQGAAILKYLVAALLDGTPLGKQLVSVIIPGTNVDVPPGSDVGGTFDKIPLCRDRSQTGCVIVYSSYLANEPPGDDAQFGMSARPGMRDGCVNPSLLYDGETRLHAILPTLIDGVRESFGARFFETPGLLSAACLSDAKHSYLAISLGQDAREKKVQALLAQVAKNQRWGLHELDINLATGDLIGIVDAQSRAWRAR